MSARPEDFHLIGHSLGSHICGYAGARTSNLGRISGIYITIFDIYINLQCKLIMRLR